MQQATVNLFADMGVQPATLQSGSSPARAPPTPRRPRRRSPRPRAARRLPTVRRYTIRAPPPTRGGLVAGGRGLDRRRRDVAPRHGPQLLDLQLDAGGDGPPRSARARSTTAATSRRPRSGHHRRRPLPLHASGPTTTSADPVDDRHEGRSSSASSSAPTSPARSPGVRFYKGAANTGTHIGSLWTTGGTLLARGDVHRRDGLGLAGGAASTRRSRSPPGRRTSPRTTRRTAATRSTAGTSQRGLDARRRSPRSASGVDGGNGVYAYGAAPTSRRSRYRRATTGSTSSSTRDARRYGDRRVSRGDAHGEQRDADARGAITATFSEANGAGDDLRGTVELRDAPTARSCPAIVSYDAATRTATFEPDAPLALSATYTATVKGGQRGVQDSPGNMLAADVSWSFTTAAPRRARAALVLHRGARDDGERRHATRSSSASSSSADVDGWIDRSPLLQGARQHRHPHRQPLDRGGALLAPRHLHERDGLRLAAGRLPARSRSRAGTTYVASYHAPNGPLRASPAMLRGAGVDNPPLRALRERPRRRQRRLPVRARARVPDQTSRPPTTGSTSSSRPSAPTTTARPRSRTPRRRRDRRCRRAAAVTATFSEPMDSTTLSSATFELRDAGGASRSPPTVSYAPRDAHGDAPAHERSRSERRTSRPSGAAPPASRTSRQPAARRLAWSFATRHARARCSSSGDAPALESSSDSGRSSSEFASGADIAGYVTRRPLLQGQPQHRHAHRQSVVGTGALLARATFADESAPAGRRSFRRARSPSLRARPTSPRTTPPRRVRRRPSVRSLRHSTTRPCTRSRRRRRRQRRLRVRSTPVFPGSSLRVEQLLGRRRFRHGRPDGQPSAHRLSSIAEQWSDRRPVWDHHPRVVQRGG